MKTGDAEPFCPCQHGNLCFKLSGTEESETEMHAEGSCKIKLPRIDRMREIGSGLEINGKLMLTWCCWCKWSWAGPPTRGETLKKHCRAVLRTLSIRRRSSKLFLTR